VAKNPQVTVIGRSINLQAKKEAGILIIRFKLMLIISICRMGMLHIDKISIINIQVTGDTLINKSAEITTKQITPTKKI
jgi:hypothetical protein